ncbi:alanine racemase [Thalassotalea piscium]|uniref:D-serine deaminase-like pyridoxal phosphate-dependent protein n=1 Tax=Thalassotalea piscium TaxID=1230533 RepID=A0A7X0NFE1_9GAMM|nr:alanine racemase [Thalassotalea piscium]MBB6542271.1 D-serine deaminase-like pyridoxal phosphate-dependent protein [Thalassotalea piscium]
MDRRTFILAGAALGVSGYMLKPTNNGMPYNDYFSQINQSLKHSGTYLPSMLVDLDIVDNNIKALSSIMNPKVDLRIVTKSVPSPKLLAYLMEKTQTNKLMVFHQPFLNHIANTYPASDVLMGKPLPVKSAKTFYQHLDTSSQFNPSIQLQWLIDTKARLKQYLALAKSLELSLKINIELDVGLHRGGLQQPEQLDSLLEIIDANPEYLTFSGFMGYDPHVVKIPSIIKSAEQAYQESQTIYQRFIERLYTLNNKYKAQPLCFNGAGSPSIALHKNNTVANELSAGSCFVKPVDFDIPSLASFTPAAFIATPILKKMKGTLLPGVEFAQHIFPLWDPNMQETYFIYGGKWLANFESPQGLQGNALFGTSTNQEIVNAADNVNLAVDDHIFLRPKQSEFVFLQFGSLITLRDHKVNEQWPILKQE